MKPVMQTVFTMTRGDCFSACVASILEIELVEVPFFNDDPVEEWWSRFKSWLATRDLDATYYQSPEPQPGYTIVGGRSPRFPTRMHACVAKHGVIVHDPHPDGSGLLNIEDHIVIHGPNRAALGFNGVS